MDSRKNRHESPPFIFSLNQSCQLHTAHHSAGLLASVISLYVRRRIATMWAVKKIMSNPIQEPAYRGQSSRNPTVHEMLFPYSFLDFHSSQKPGTQRTQGLLTHLFSYWYPVKTSKSTLNQNTCVEKIRQAIENNQRQPARNPGKPKKPKLCGNCTIYLPGSTKRRPHAECRTAVPNEPRLSRPPTGTRSRQNV